MPATTGRPLSCPSPCKAERVGCAVTYPSGPTDGVLILKKLRSEFGEFGWLGVGDARVRLERKKRKSHKKRHRDARTKVEERDGNERPGRELS